MTTTIETEAAVPTDTGALHAVLASGARPRRPGAVSVSMTFGHRALLRSRGIRAVIPEPADQAANRRRRGSAGGRPIGLDIEDYKQRNVVERFFNRMKNWRGLASRYDKLATVFRGSVILAAIVDWLR